MDRIAVRRLILIFLAMQIFGCASVDKEGEYRRSLMSVLVMGAVDDISLLKIGTVVDSNDVYVAVIKNSDAKLVLLKGLGPDLSEMSAVDINGLCSLIIAYGGISRDVFGGEGYWADAHSVAANYLDGLRSAVMDYIKRDKIIKYNPSYCLR